jgi:hypothetical protein
MACIAFSQLFPSAPEGQDYDTFIRSQASQQGLMCSISKYATACDSQCKQVSKNFAASGLPSSGCFACLSSVTTCPLPTNPSMPCCAFINQAVECNTCLASNDLDTCLNSGALSAGAIAGIVIACVVVVIIIIVVAVVFTQRKKEALISQVMQRKGYGEEQRLILEKLSDVELTNQLESLQTF